MPQDFAPLLRKLAILAVLFLGGTFALMMKGGAFKNDRFVVVMLIGALVLAAGIFTIHLLDSDRARSTKIPNPLHPANRPSEPPAV